MEDPVCRSDETQLGALARAGLQHDLHLSFGDWDSWSNMSSLLRDAGADVQNVQISRYDDGFSVRCRLTSISSEAARDLAARALDGGLASRARVEHLLLAASAGR